MDLPCMIAFDGNDTLCHNEPLLSMTQGRFRALLSRHVDIPIDILNARLLDTERHNIPTYGYGIEGFVLSMIETRLVRHHHELETLLVQELRRVRPGHKVEFIDIR